jgi:hypothetical protein
MLLLDLDEKYQEKNIQAETLHHPNVTVSDSLSNESTTDDCIFP